MHLTVGVPMNPPVGGLVVALRASMCGERNIPEVAAQAVRGGAGTIELITDQAAWLMVERARAVKKALAGTDARVVVEGRIDLALAADIDGVFLGPEDLNIPEGRRLLPPGRFIGKGVGTLEEAQEAEAMRADYIGIGPVIYDRTMQHHPWGLERVGELCAQISIPVVAGGGIDAGNIAEILKAGVTAVAVGNAVGAAADPQAAAAELVCAGWGSSQREGR